MTIIKPVSDLRNYPSVLEEVDKGNRVHLTKNGRGSYVIMTLAEFEEYDKDKATLQLMSELSKGKSSQFISFDEFTKNLKEYLDEK